MLTARAADMSRWRRSFKMPMVLGGLGLLACAGCCALPLLLGAVGLAGGVAAMSGVLEPLAAVLLVLGVGAAVASFIRLRRRRSRCQVTGSASCATDGGCGCAPTTGG